MKKRIIEILIILIICVTSCGHVESDSESGAIKVIEVEKLVEKNLFSFKRPIDNCHFVALETTDECLIGEMKKVEIKNDFIFVLDENNKLYVFNKKGKYLNRIGRIGQGNEELLSFVDFYVNTKKQYVGIYDVYRAKVLRYKFDGKYLGSYKCSEKMNNTRHIVGHYGNSLLIALANHNQSKYNYIEVSEADYSLKNEYLPFGIIGNVSSTASTYTTSSTNNGLYLTTFFSDSIYCFSNKDVIDPNIVIRSSEQKGANSETLKSINDMQIESVFSAQPILRNKGYSIGIRSIFATDDFLNINYPMPKYQVCNIFYNLKSGKAYKSTTIRVDFFGNGFGEALTTTDKEIVYAIQPERMIEISKTPKLFSSSKVLESVKQVGEFDNPVLVFFTSGYEE